MTERLRRAVPRQPADWFGFYRFDTSEIDPWRCCRILDISPLGAGLELFAITPDETADSEITVSFELRGVPRNIVWGEDNDTARLGMQFPELTETAKEYLRVMSGSRSRW